MIPNPENSELYNLSHPQMNIWGGQMLSPNKPLYNMVMAFHFKGNVNEMQFGEAFQKLVNHFDVLRITFKTDLGLPKQKILDKVENTHSFKDLSSLDKPEVRLNDWIDQNKVKVFSDGEVLYHSVLLKVSEEHFVWYFNHHHLITDGVTIHLLYQQLLDFYKEESSQASIANQFSYEKVIQDHPNDSVITDSNYWNELKENIGLPPPLYGKRSENSLSNSTRIVVKLGKENTAKLRKMASEPPLRGWNIDMSLFVIFQTILNALVYKVSGQEYFFTGFASHNRVKASQRKTAGLFMELLPLKVAVSNQDSLLELFEKTRAESFEVMKQAGDAKPSAGLLRSFNTMLNFIPGHFAPFGKVQVFCDWVHSGHSDPGHHIRLQVHDFNSEEDYSLQFDLNDKVFDSFTQSNIPEHFIKLLDAFIDDMNQKLGDVSIITKEELDKIAVWNDTNVTYDANETLLTKFEAQVLKTPDNVALWYGEESMTYQELNKRANQFANYLTGEGIKQGEIVAVGLERSFDVYIAIYGILKVGAAYLPIDTNIPEKRLKYILEDASVSLLMVNHNNFDLFKFPELRIQNFQNVNLNDFQDLVIKKEADQNGLAYVIYTSGSTGKPKGVACNHKGICNRLNWMSDFNPLSISDRMMLKTPLTFDVSIPELFWPLQSGASVVIEHHDGHKDSNQLIQTILSKEVTIIHFVPSMLGVFLENSAVYKCKDLIRQIFCTGEALPVTTVNKAHELLDVEVFNLYGPTEASVEVSYWKSVEKETFSSMPIGYPMSNTGLHILDEAHNVVPLGIVGELYITGSQLAIGYLNNAKLTDQTFLQSVFSSNKQDRMYKTGDLARQKTDGSIEYLGRIDHQVKLRGYRIELGEIEEVMSVYPSLDQAVVGLREENNLAKSLVGFYVGKNINHLHLKNFLAESLPYYMVPDLYVEVAEFTMASSGKVDRKSLPFNLIKSDDQEDYLAPSTDIEQLVADIWSDVLKKERIGINENFVQIGGDSLSAISITSRFLDQINLDIEINLVFQKPTIAQYSSHIEQLMIEIMAQE